MKNRMVVAQSFRQDMRKMLENVQLKLWWQGNWFDLSSTLRLFSESEICSFHYNIFNQFKCWYMQNQAYLQRNRASNSNVNTRHIGFTRLVYIRGWNIIHSHTSLTRYKDDTSLAILLPSSHSFVTIIFLLLTHFKPPINYNFIIYF